MNGAQFRVATTVQEKVKTLSVKFFLTPRLADLRDTVGYEYPDLIITLDEISN